MAEYAHDSSSITLDISGAAADATSPQDLAAINPTDNVTTIMVGFATNDVARTYSSQTIGGSAATERVDASQNGNASITLFDRLDVATGVSTFAAQATVSNTPTNGAIALLIFKLAPDATIVVPLGTMALAGLVASVLIAYAIPITVLTVPAKPTLVVE